MMSLDLGPRMLLIPAGVLIFTFVVAYLVMRIVLKKIGETKRWKAILYAAILTPLLAYALFDYLFMGPGPDWFADLLNWLF